MNAQSAAKTRPTAQAGIAGPAELIALAMEFDCTIEPIKPSARIAAIEKNTARNLPKPPLNAFLM